MTPSAADTVYKTKGDLELEQLADEAFRLLGGQLQRETRCGKGSYGAVWLAREKMTRRRVAVKVVRKTPDGAWQREYTGVRQYCEHIRRVHPHLLVIHHLVEGENFFCYSMEAADNAHAETDVYQPDTLGLRLRCGEPLPLENVKRYGLQLMDALQCLHAAGLVHRDLKPDNVVFVNKEIKLADIGLVSLIHPELSVVGTPDYIPESQTRATESDGVAQDVYALGKVLYCLMSGLSVNQFPRMPPAVSGDALCPPLNAAILAACHPNPARRFQNIREFRGAWNAGPRGTRLRRIPVLAGAAVLIAVCAVFAARRFAGTREPPAPAAPPAPAQTVASTEWVSGKIVVYENSGEAGIPILQISDTHDPKAWKLAEDGLTWTFGTNETDALTLELKGCPLPDTADISVTLSHKGASGCYYRIFAYNAAKWKGVPFDHRSNREHCRLVDRGIIKNEAKTYPPFTFEKKSGNDALAFVFTSSLQDIRHMQDEIVIKNITIRFPDKNSH